MNLLIKHGLFGGGLITIDSPQLVNRYNTALKEIGLKTTKLKSFRIDGMGWSPEIAEELDDFYYLTHGGTVNPYAIIVTPKQFGKPLYAMHHSFDLEMLNSVFIHNSKQIEDITNEEAIWFLIDDGIEYYDLPSSLLLINSIKLAFNATNKLIEAAEHQKGLALRFFVEPLSWMDQKLIDMILESVNKYGDMRHRQILMYHMHFNGFTSYYTRSFGGVFVLREEQLHNKPILLCEDEKWQRLRIEMKDFETSFLLMSVGDQSKKLLIENDFLHIDPEYWKRNLLRLELMKQYYLMKSLSKIGMTIHQVESLLDDKYFYQATVVALRKNGDLHTKYDQLEKFINYVKDPSIGMSFDIAVIADQVLTPNKKVLSKQSQEVLWRYLARVRNSDVLMNYAMEKELFFKRYLNWDETMKYWAVKMLSNNYFTVNYVNSKKEN